MSTMFRTILVVAGLVAVQLASSAAPLQAQSSLETIEQVSSRVVKIFGAGGVRGLYSYGSGFLISPDGHIVTVWSHVLDVEPFAVVLSDGRRYEGRVLAAEPQLDLAVIKIEAEQLPYFDLSRATTAGPGTRVLAFSNMFQVALGDEPVSVIRGLISAQTTLTARRGTFEVPYHGQVYVVDAITNNPGAGGGVLTTYDGRLLGMIGKELRNSETNTWVNYVMPISELQATIQSIQSGEFVSGRTRTDENEELNPALLRKPNYSALQFGLVLLPDVVPRTPAFIDRTLIGSAAEIAGLQPDDLVLFVGDDLVQSVRQFHSVLAKLESGGELTIVVRRKDQLISVRLPIPAPLAPLGGTPLDSSIPAASGDFGSETQEPQP